MAKTQGSYETMLVLSMKQGEEGVNKLIEKFSALISENGTIDSVDNWGKRKLAYEINDESEAFYYLINFTSKPDFIKELERVYRITDGILRTLVVSTDVK